jgi:hypothetical protein
MDCCLGGIIGEGEGAVDPDRKIHGSHFDQKIESFIMFIED